MLKSAKNRIKRKGWRNKPTHFHFATFCMLTTLFCQGSLMIWLKMEIYLIKSLFLKSAWRHSVIDRYDKARNNPFFVQWHLGDKIGVYCWPQCNYNKRFCKSHDRLSIITTGNRCKDKKEEIWPSPMTKAPTPTEMSKGTTQTTPKKFD